MRISPCSQAKLPAVGALREARRMDGATDQSATRPTVSLSEAARQMSALDSTTQEVDLQKVQALREAIANGQFQMDAADSLIASAQDLLK